MEDKKEVEGIGIADEVFFEEASDGNRFEEGNEPDRGEPGEETSEEASKLSDEQSDAVCPCCKKTMRSDEERRKLINRLNSIEGQIRGIRGMLERDAYCNDILIQSAAVNAAVNSFNKELLSSHIHTCVVRDIREGKDEVVDELVATIQKLMK